MRESARWTIPDRWSGNVKIRSPSPSLYYVRLATLMRYTRVEGEALDQSRSRFEE